MFKSPREPLFKSGDWVNVAGFCFFLSFGDGFWGVQRKTAVSGFKSVSGFCSSLFLSCSWVKGCFNPKNDEIKG